MHVIRHRDCDEFAAADGCRLREYLHPDKAPLAIRYSLAHATVSPGQVTRRHSLRTSEVYVILEGRGRMHIDDGVQEVEALDSVYIPPGAVQWIENIGSVPLTFLCLVDPAWRREDETVHV